MVGVDVNVAECRSDCTLNDDEDEEDEENEKGRTVSRRSAADDDDDAGKAGDGKHAAVDKGKTE